MSLRGSDYAVCDEFSVWVSSWGEDYSGSDPIVAERSMYFDYGGIRGGHQALGVSTPWYEWYFAEGYTGDGFDEYLCVYNPGYVSTARVMLELVDEEGNLVERELTLPSEGRVTVKVNDIIPDRAVSAKLKAVDNITFVAERSMYFSYGDGIEGGHVSGGVRSPSESWYFAEGYSSP